MAKVRDMASVPSGHLLLLLENCRERCIKVVEKINRLKIFDWKFMLVMGARSTKSK